MRPFVGAAMLSVFTTAAVILLRNRIWVVCRPKDLCCELFCMIGNQRIFILSATFTQKLENFVWVITGKYLSHVFFDGHLFTTFWGEWKHRTLGSDRKTSEETSRGIHNDDRSVWASSSFSFLLL